VSEQLPEIMLFWNLNPQVFVATLRGPVQTAMLATGGESWNIYEWELRYPDSFSVAWEGVGTLPPVLDSARVRA
jgi:hypothetical protein